MAGEGFLGRWVRLKRDADVAQKQSDPVQSDPADARPQGAADSPAPVAAIPAAAGALPAPGDEASSAAGVLADREGGPAGDPLELPSIDSLGMESDFSLFMRAEVDPGLRTSALKKLFTDPHFNRMDGLDIYIDDYSKPDPMPLAMLKRLNQSRLLGLMEEEPAQAGVAQTGGQHVAGAPPLDPAGVDAGGDSLPSGDTTPATPDAGPTAIEAADSLPGDGMGTAVPAVGAPAGAGPGADVRAGGAAPTNQPNPRQTS